MLNERNEIMALLNGERINKKYTYRSCYLLAKYYKSLGYDTVKTREEIFMWAKKFNIYISDDLNSIIQRAYNDKHGIAENVDIRISKEDIDEIVKRFDKYNTRLTAFAMLCVAKKYADKNGIFYISRIGLSNWIGIAQTHLSDRYIKELIDFEYLEKLTQNEMKFIRIRRKNISKIIMYKIRVNIKNEGEYLVKDYNIRKEFEEIMLNYDTIYCVPQNSTTK